MREAGGKSFWGIALALSLAAHAAFMLFIPDFAPKTEIRPIMRVRLAMAEKKSTPTPAPVKEEAPSEKKAVMKKEAVPKKEPQKKAEPAKSAKTPSEKSPVQEVQARADTSDSVAGTQVNAGINAAHTDPPQTTPPQVQPERVVEIDSLEVVKKVLPDYSSFSRKRKEEGTVKIIVTVTEGRVVSAEVESSSGYLRLDESALRAVKQWLFKNSGTVRVRVPVVFRLK